MSFEPLYIESWIYTTLHDDDTLTEALADVEGHAPGYQQGIYMHLAPQFDRVSQSAPQVPYIVVTREGGGPYERGLCGDRAITTPVYRVTIWDSQNGAVAMDRLLAIADRVDALLDSQGNATAPAFGCWQIASDTVVEQQQGGEVFYGVAIDYEFQTGV